MCTRTVSYTHLDVYKRQLEAFWEDEQPLAPMMVARATTTVAKAQTMCRVNWTRAERRRRSKCRFIWNPLLGHDGSAL